MRHEKPDQDSHPSTETTTDVFKRAIDTLTLVVIVAGLYFAWDQAKQFNASQNLSNWSDVSARTFEIDKVFVENPDFQKYFLEGADITPDNKDYPKAMAIAELLLDYLDSFTSLLDYNQGLISNNILQKEAWNHYFSQTFTRSPLLCRRLIADPLNYGQQLRQTGIPLCEKTFPALKQSQH
jgi:hypothetical protein